LPEDSDIDAAVVLSHDQPQLFDLSRRTLRNSSGPFISLLFRLALSSDVAPVSASRSSASEASSFARIRGLSRFDSGDSRIGRSRSPSSAVFTSSCTASDRLGLCFWLSAHASTWSRSSGVSRTARPCSAVPADVFRGTAFDLDISDIIDWRAITAMPREERRESGHFRSRLQLMTAVA
jgi:hypothetical protein